MRQNSGDGGIGHNTPAIRNPNAIKSPVARRIIGVRALGSVSLAEGEGPDKDASRHQQRGQQHNLYVHAHRRNKVAGITMRS